MKKLLAVVAIAIGAYAAVSYYGGSRPSAVVESGGNADELLASAFKQHKSNVVTEGQGIVVKLLSDDNDGSRHQRFIVRLRSGQTLLVAHNIDLSRRVESLGVGDTVTFKGEYEWNPAGGVIHWTHADPAGSHPSGWIQHDGTTYQ